MRIFGLTRLYALDRSTWLTVISRDLWTNLELSMPVSDEGIKAYKAKILTVILANSMPVIRILILRLKDVMGELSNFVSRKSGRVPSLNAVCAH